MSRKNGHKKVVEISIEDQLKGHLAQLIWMQEQMHQIKREINKIKRETSKAEIKKIVDEVYEEECNRLETLRDDAVRVLNKLVEAGAITREELNEATQK